MLIEQINEFELRGPGPTGGTCTTTAGYFHDKTKISKEDLRVDYFIIYCQNIAEGNVPYFPSTWAKSRTKFNPKI